MTRLEKPDYIETNRAGQISKIYCKICGKPIAITAKGSLKLLSNYAQMKMTFSDGSAHVTVLGRECLKIASANKTTMDALFKADIAHFEKELPGNPAWSRLKEKTSPKFNRAETRKVPME